MARLHEYQGKAILAANGFKIPRGRAVSTADEAITLAKEFAAEKKPEVVIKIQAWTTGRAGIGGVAFAIDDAARAPVIVFGAGGGSGIEERAASTRRIACDVKSGPLLPAVDEAVGSCGLVPVHAKQLADSI